VLPRWTPPAEAVGDEYDCTRRTTRAAFETIDASTTSLLRAACRANGLTISAAINAAAALCTTDVLGAELEHAARTDTGAHLTKRFKVSIHLSIHPSIYSSIHLAICVYLSFYLSIYLPVYVDGRADRHGRAPHQALQGIYPYIYPSIYPSIHPYVYLSICLSIYPPISIYLST